MFHLLDPNSDGIPCIITAVADAVRTSLGPKGMDKMVLHSGTNNDDDKLISKPNAIDPNRKWRGGHHKRRSYHLEAHGCFAPCCPNGTHRRTMQFQSFDGLTPAVFSV